MLRPPPTAIHMTKHEVLETITRRDRQHRSSDIFPLHGRITTVAKSNAKSPILHPGPQHCRDAAVVHPHRTVSLNSSPDPLSIPQELAPVANPENQPLEEDSFTLGELSFYLSQNASSTTKSSSAATSDASDVDGGSEVQLVDRHRIQSISQWHRSTSLASIQPQHLVPRRILNRSSSDTVIASPYGRAAGDGQLQSLWNTQSFSTQTLFDTTSDNYLQDPYAPYVPQTPDLRLPVPETQTTNDRELEAQRTGSVQSRRDMNASIEAANDRSSPLDTLAHSLIASLPMSWAQASRNERGRNSLGRQRRLSIRSRTPSWAAPESTRLMQEIYPRRRAVSALQENEEPMEQFESERRLFWARRQQPQEAEDVLESTPPAAGRLGRFL